MSKKYALIIGNTEYTDPDLSKLTSPGKDTTDFARVLQSPNHGAFDNVTVLLNESDSIVREAIDELFIQKKSDDLLVLYFSGHGVRDEQGALYLAVKNTKRSYLRSTAIKSDFIREAMDQSHSRRQVLILDCCNSGAFSYGTKAVTGASMGTASAFQGTGYGRIVLTASDSTQFAWEGNKIIGHIENSLFTHFLIKGMEGEADKNADGQITVSELYEYVYEEIVSLTPKQTPSKWSYNQKGEITLCQLTEIKQKQMRALQLQAQERLAHKEADKLMQAQLARDKKERASQEKQEKRRLRLSVISNTLQKILQGTKLYYRRSLFVILVGISIFTVIKFAPSLFPPVSTPTQTVFLTSTSTKKAAPRNTPTLAATKPPTPKAIVPTNTNSISNIPGSTQISAKDGAVMVLIPASGDVKSFWIDQKAVTTAMFGKFIQSTNYQTDAEKNGVGNVWTSLGEIPGPKFGDSFFGASQTYIGFKWFITSRVDWKTPAFEEATKNTFQYLPSIHTNQVLQVSWNDAKEYCQWAGRDLVALNEWDVAKGKNYGNISYNDYLGEWGEDQTNSGRRIILGYQTINYIGTAPFGKDGFIESRSANIITFRCKDR